jgi:hypothetical protein
VCEIERAVDSKFVLEWLYKSVCGTASKRELWRWVTRTMARHRDRREEGKTEGWKKRDRDRYGESTCREYSSWHRYTMLFNPSFFRKAKFFLVGYALLNTPLYTIAKFFGGYNCRQ